MELLFQLLWAAMLLLFFAGAVAYAFQPHLGLILLKRSLVFLVVLLIGPSLLRSAFDQVPLPALFVIFAVASVAAYGYLSQHSVKGTKHRHGSGSSHAERQPHLPQEEDDE